MWAAPLGPSSELTSGCQGIPQEHHHTSPKKAIRKTSATYLLLIDQILHLLHPRDHALKALPLILLSNHYALLGVAQDPHGLVEGLRLVGPRVAHHVPQEGLLTRHVGKHSENVDKEGPGIKIVCVWVIDFQFETLLADKRIQAEV